MTYKESYERRKPELLAAVNKANQKLFLKFFEKEEYKLKRQNGLDKLDESSYLTLLGYVGKFSVVDKMFKGKAWVNLSKADIKKVYDGLEDGTIKNKYGKPYKDKRDFYDKIFRSLPFQLAGKSDIAHEILEFAQNKDNDEPRFFEEDTFRRLVGCINNTKHLCLMWLAWDVGENINSLLKLKKKNFTPQTNPDTKEREYLINLHRRILKRSRKARGEITNHAETAHYLDIILKDLKDDDLLFSFGYGGAKKFLSRAVKKIDGKVKPNNAKIVWKDFRSSMAVYLMNKSWDTTEINCRLGHNPSSRVLDKYINFLGLKRHEPKKKIYNHDLADIKERLEESKHTEKRLVSRLMRYSEENKQLREELTNKLKKYEADQNEIKQRHDKMVELILTIKEKFKI